MVPVRAARVQLRNRLGGQRGSVKAQIVHRPLKTFPPVQRPDARGRGPAPNRLAGTFNSADLVSVEVNARKTPVEGGRAMVPRAVKDGRGLEQRIALKIAVDMESQREYGAVVLKRKQHTLLAVLFSEEFTVAAELRREHPYGQGELGGAIKKRGVRDHKPVRAGKQQRLAEKPARTCDGAVIRALWRGIESIAARVRTRAPEAGIKRPMGEEGRAGGSRFVRNNPGAQQPRRQQKKTEANNTAHNSRHVRTGHHHGLLQAQPLRVNPCHAAGPSASVPRPYHPDDLRLSMP